MKKRIGLVRAAVGVLALAVLGPAIAESQIFVICGVYRNSYADTGRQPLPRYTVRDVSSARSSCSRRTKVDVPMDPPHPGSDAGLLHIRLRLRVQEPSQPVSLALDTGLASTPQRLSACEGPSPYDRIRTARRERVPPLVNDRSRRGLMEAGVSPLKTASLGAFALWAIIATQSAVAQEPGLLSPVLEDLRPLAPPDGLSSAADVRWQADGSLLVGLRQKRDLLVAPWGTRI